MPFFGCRRERVERESGTVTCHAIKQLCLSALAESSSGRCGTVWMMLRVGRCLNVDPGPLPGPRQCDDINSSDLSTVCCTAITDISEYQLRLLTVYIPYIVCHYREP